MSKNCKTWTFARYDAPSGPSGQSSAAHNTSNPLEKEAA
jgi:hypothetical protein